MMNNMEHEPGHQERGPYNLRNDFEGVRNAIAIVEGEAWLRAEQRISSNWDEVSEGERETSLEGARRWLGRVPPDEDIWHTVYGTFGVDRWYIHADGSVRFSESHASPQGLQLAKEKGFWIG